MSDEDWSDDEPGEETASPCPECGRPVFEISERCPACGYWLTSEDRQTMWTGSSKPTWLRVTAVVVLIAFLASLVGGLFFF